MFLGTKFMEKVNGRKKDLKGKEIKTLTAKKLYYPLSWFGHEATSVAKPGTAITKGQLLMKFPTKFDTPIFAGASGKVGATVKISNTNGEETEALVIDVKDDGKEKLMAKLDHKKAPRQKMLDRIKAAGIVGLGGGVFPTHIKLSANKLKTVVVNAVECEPILVSDYAAIKSNSEKVIGGIHAAIRAAGATNAIIGIKGNSKLAIEALENAIENLNASGFIKIKKVKNRYPMGWERHLVLKTTGKKYNKLPSEQGIVVINSTTALAIYNAIVEGKVITSKYVTVGGNNVSEEGIAEVPVGMMVQDVLAEAKIKIENDDHSIQLGGPMMGASVDSTKSVVTIGVNGIVINKLIDYDKQAMECAACGKCVIKCPVAIQPIVIKKAYEAKEFDMMIPLEVDKCIECGLCSAGCPSRVKLKEFTSKAKTVALAKLRVAAAQSKAAKK